MFDKEDSGLIAVGEIKYILTQLGERMDDAEADEVLKMADVGSDGQVNYEVRLPSPPRSLASSPCLLFFFLGVSALSPSSFSVPCAGSTSALGSLTPD